MASRSLGDQLADFPGWSARSLLDKLPPSQAPKLGRRVHGPSACPTWPPTLSPCTRNPVQMLPGPGYSAAVRHELKAHETIAFVQQHSLASLRNEVAVATGQDAATVSR